MEPNEITTPEQYQIAKRVIARKCTTWAERSRLIAMVDKYKRVRSRASAKEKERIRLAELDARRALQDAQREIRNEKQRIARAKVDARKAQKNDFSYIGARYGRLTITSVRRDEITSFRHARAHCVCGNVKEYRLDNLRNGKTKSCGCLKALNPTDYIGSEYGELTITDMWSEKDGAERLRWNVEAQCHCGDRSTYRLDWLRYDEIKRCFTCSPSSLSRFTVPIDAEAITPCLS